MAAMTTTPRERAVDLTGDEVRAALAGTRTEIRRVVKPQPKNDRVGMVNAGYCGEPNLWFVAGAVSEYTCNGEIPPVWSCRIGEVGDVLWVREPWFVRSNAGHYNEDDDGITITYLDNSIACFDGYDGIVPDEWTIPKGAKHGLRRLSSILMPRWASRITLEVTAVRVEQVDSLWTWIASVRRVPETQEGMK